MQMEILEKIVKMLDEKGQLLDKQELLSASRAAYESGDLDLAAYLEGVASEGLELLIRSGARLAQRAKAQAESSAAI